jgi:rSAM-associated Gly-rich repeat protein
MSRHNRYLQFLTALLPAGAFGLSVALASNAAKATVSEEEQPRVDRGPATFSVANELQAIRDAVDEARAEITGGQVGQTTDGNVRLAWWLNGNGLGWGNGGRVWGNGGYPGWGNVRPWGNGWGNGGWGNGGWHNWHNWRNY